MRPHGAYLRMERLNELMCSREQQACSRHCSPVWLYNLLYNLLLYKLYNRAVERYTADTHPTTGLQSYTAYTALYTIQLYSLYIIQHYTITLC